MTKLYLKILLILSLCTPLYGTQDYDNVNNFIYKYYPFLVRTYKYKSALNFNMKFFMTTNTINLWFIYRF